MSMSMDGEVHDYYNGMDDLQNKVSKFLQTHFTLSIRICNKMTHYM